MPRMDKLSSHKTAWTTNDKGGSVIYCETEIVRWTNKTITLRSGGWETNTTKNKMNQSANQFVLQFGVYQKNYKWFVDTPTGQTVPFVDGMTIARA